MIPHTMITAWQRHAPWSTDAQIEQDLVLSRAILDLYTDPQLPEQIAFRGGTALHKLFLAPAARYSDDLDLVQMRAEPIGPVLNTIRRHLDPWLGTPQWELKHGRAILVYRFDATGLPATRLRLKIEINTREHFTVRGFARVPFTVANPWYQNTTEIVTYELEELLGTKLRALYQRKKGRDLFDFEVAFARVPTLDGAAVVHCFEEYMRHTGTTVSRAEFEANLTEKLTDAAFTADISPLLSTNGIEAFDPQRAGDNIRTRLLARLQGEPWKGGTTSARRAK